MVKTTIKLIVNDNFYVFQKIGMVGNSIIIWNTVSVGTGISRPTFIPVAPVPQSTKLALPKSNIIRSRFIPKHKWQP